MPKDEFLLSRLQERKIAGSFRSLSTTGNLIDFTSNDYLGIRHGNRLAKYVHHADNHGSGSSRLLSGNHALFEEAESKIATFHKSQRALIFNSGYDANVGLLSGIPQRGDTIFYDQLCHASIRDGIRLSLAQSFSFRHNDVNDLEKKLSHRRGNCFVVTESVFSMDGDKAPLTDLLTLCNKHELHMIVDEAHAVGVVGLQGEGLASHLGIDQKIFARVYTFGKALGCHGAAIVGSELLASALINFARSFIYSTALPETSVRAIMASYEIFPGMEAERQKLAHLIASFHKMTSSLPTPGGDSPIQGLFVKGNGAVLQASLTLRSAGLDVRAIRHPTVAAGSERLRINLHAFNGEADLKKLSGELHNIVKVDG